VKESNRLKQDIKRIEDIEQIDVNKVIEIGQIIDNIHDIWIMGNPRRKRQAL